MNTLRQETLELRALYDEEPSHSDHVAFLALQIFDAMRTSLMLEERARDLLHSAALLHDIGWSQTSDGRGHHKESERLIREHAWRSLSGEEVPVVAQVARYHRKALPKRDHDAFQTLSIQNQRLVEILGGILRVADALDRTHIGRIVKADAALTAKALTIRVEHKGNWEAEQAMFELKRDLLERALDVRVRCEAME